ncbi:MAG TPA: T9SS type A sorting domain-containing protein [Panacibacter sp.]|nr:T9SS type A sorting domain-containing protein [Panacibacter sp.]
MKKALLIITMCAAAFPALSQWSVDSLINVCANDAVSTYQQKTMFVNYGSWELYDLQTQNSVTGFLSLGRNSIQVATVRNVAYFGGGQYGPYTDPVYTNNVDVYDFVSNTWTLSKLSRAREVGAAAAIGNKILFAGGRDAINMYNTVDIFDVRTGARTTAKLSKARTNISVAVNGNKVVFAGGWYFDFSYNRPASNAVDIYDASTGLWSTATLSQKRQGMSVASVGTKILFAGGIPNSGGTNRVDIYDVATNAWSTASLSAQRSSMTVNVIGSKAYFASGIGASNKIDVYDAASNSWSVVTMPYNLVGAAGAVVNNQVFYAGGYDPSTYAVSNALQIYNTATNSWTTGIISQARASSNVVSIGNITIFAGGFTKVTYPAVGSTRLDIYNAVPGFIAKTNTFDFTFFPNPVLNEINFSVNKESKFPVLVRLYNDKGNEVATYRVVSESTRIFIGNVPKGKYFLSACDDGKNCVSKIIFKL